MLRHFHRHVAHWVEAAFRLPEAVRIVTVAADLKWSIGLQKFLGRPWQPLDFEKVNKAARFWTLCRDLLELCMVLRKGSSDTCSFNTMKIMDLVEERRVMFVGDQEQKEITQVKDVHHKYFRVR